MLDAGEKNYGDLRKGLKECMRGEEDIRAGLHWEVKQGWERDSHSERRWLEELENTGTECGKHMDENGL